jgi:hypothetical protein
MTLKREPLLKPRGRPFKPGNPGRPPGARNKATQAIEQLAEGHAESLGEKVMELALGGDVTCQSAKDALRLMRPPHCLSSWTARFRQSSCTTL